MLLPSTGSSWARNDAMPAPVVGACDDDAMPAPVAERLAAAEVELKQAAVRVGRLRAELLQAERTISEAAPRVERFSPATATVSALLRALMRDGAVVVENLGSRSQMDGVCGELAALSSFAYRGEPGSFAGANTARNGAYLIGACPSTHALATHPLVHETAQQMLGPYCRRVALAVASEIRVLDSSPAQVLHRDDEEWPLELLARKRAGAEMQLEAMWALSDFTAVNGASEFCRILLTRTGSL